MSEALYDQIYVSKKPHKYLAGLQSNSGQWIDVVRLMSDINVFDNLCIQALEFALQSGLSFFSGFFLYDNQRILSFQEILNEIK